MEPAFTSVEALCGRLKVVPIDKVGQSWFMLFLGFRDLSMCFKRRLSACQNDKLVWHENFLIRKHTRCPLRHGATRRRVFLMEPSRRCHVFSF